MPNAIRMFTLAALAIVAAQPSFAQEGLLEIYQRALQNDPQIRRDEALYLATLELRAMARSAVFPNLRLGASTSASFSENPFGATTGAGQVFGIGSEFESDANSWNLNLSQTLFDWSQIKTLRQVDKQITRAEAAFEAARQNLLIRTAETYFSVLAAEETLASEIVSREAIARQLEQAQRRFEVGLIAITEVEQAQANYDLAVANTIQAERVLSITQEALRELIGEYITNLAGPTEELPLVRPDPASADDWVSLALRQNLTLISSRLDADIAEDTIAIQRGARYPTLSLSAGYSDSSTDSTVTLFFEDAITGDRFSRPNANPSARSGYNWSLNFSVPIFSGGINSARIQQAVYQRRAALEIVELAARQTERQTRDAYLGVISEISRVQALRQAVGSSQTALRATEAGFEVGTQTTVDVLVQQEVLRRAQTNYALSRYDYLMNGLRLKEAAGSLAVQDIEQIDAWFE
ncbi:TolC family outer membrane protein [Candidatus Rariloculus sp.]|uniref:TolC family outer membrane protein n=1 Tax=Candidatus Rariloculus sp. TaxID=3101265 RepID=UPI003D104ED6